MLRVIGKNLAKGVSTLTPLVLVGLVLLLVSIGRSSAAEAQPDRPGARNIIFMVPDGLGLASLTAVRIYKNGLGGDPLHMELENIGYQRTYSADSTVTDSAAAASAWACGEKFNNGRICRHSDGRPHNESILEIARKRGKATGLVATSTITHATPAAFAAHVASRKCETEIARQFITESGVDVLLGGGEEKFKTLEPDACGTFGDFIEVARSGGYALAYNKTEMDAAVAGGARKLLGLFHKGALTPEEKRTAETVEPRLPEMTSAALNILEKNGEGFFLLVEGSQIDWAGHKHDLKYQMAEIIAFDEAVKEVLDWVDGLPSRKSTTLIIVTPDHETSGFAINGPTDSLTGVGETIEAGWTTNWHTGGDVIIWSQGPGSDSLRGPGIENTFIYEVMKRVLW